MAQLKEDKAKEFSLLHSMAMGGIHGGDGYSFQDRYMVCHIPKWLSDPTFIKTMGEATGDVDVVYRKGRKHIYDHIQVKDHHVGTTEFKQIIQSFIKIDNGTGKAYRKFTLTAPSVSPDVKSFYKSLTRYNEGRKLYDAGGKKAFKTTEDAFKLILDKWGIKKYFRFVVDKLVFEIGAFDFNDNGTCKKMFIAALLDHPKYRERIAHLLTPAYSVLIEQVLAHRGKVLDQTKLYDFINKALASSPKKAKDNVLYIHNWTVEKYDHKATIEVDWSHLFDRSTRVVPESKIWDTQLIPQLQIIRQELGKKTSNRHIIFRGKCTLSTGIALGMTFPEVGNWTFELLQPPQTHSWRSDAEKLKNYRIQHELIEPISVGLSQSGNDIVFIFNITGKALDEVVNYLKENRIGIKKIILIQPQKTPGNFSIQSDSEAVALASASKDILKGFISKYKSSKTHLFYFGPLGLSVFLGQKLTSMGIIQLYEFQDPGYKPSCLIKT